MISLVLIVSLSFFSFLASAFVILRIVIPILPPHPLSRRVAPAEFGLPNYNFRSLSSADKSHLWLASLDLLALCIFIWQTVSEYPGRATGFADASGVAASARLWFALTIRQTCLLVVSGLTLIHIRMGRSVSFGHKHWLIWAPTLLLAFTSTTLAAILAGAGVRSLFVGIIAYSATTAALSTATFGGLVYTLVIIKRNLAVLNEPTDTWPPVKGTDPKPRPSFATEDIDGLREGSSWLTSDAGSSRRESISNWSFSTHTRQGSMRSVRLNPAAPQSSSQPKSLGWFTRPSSGASSSIPPVPPLPSVYRGRTSPASIVDEDPDPFRRDAPSRPRVGSQSSWLTSPSVSQATVSTWSYPNAVTTGNAGDIDMGPRSDIPSSRPATPLAGSTPDANAILLPHAFPSHPGTPMTSVIDLNAGLLPQVGPSRPPTPALSSAKVLGGYGYTADSEKGITSLAVAGSEVHISYSRYALWVLSIWVPFGLSLPYLFSIANPYSVPIEFVSIMLVLSVTLSSPLLALNILVRSPIPIPTGLFGVHTEPPSVVMRAPSPSETLGTYCRESKKSGSITVVEGHRSGDVWVSQGNAVDGKGRVGRALGLIAPLPRLAVLPPDEQQEGEITPPLPMQEDIGPTASPSPQSTNSAEFGRIGKELKALSHFSGTEAFATRIMIAQRHYSALATTVVVPASLEGTEAPDGLLGVATGVNAMPIINPSSSTHLRSRSVSSMIDQTVTIADISAPPSQPLPPTPPNIRHAKQTAKQLLHRMSRSSDFSFGATVNDNINEIDALTAGVLPLLVPGLKLGDEIKIRGWKEFSPSLSSTVTKKADTIAPISTALEFGALRYDDPDSPRFHSTPAQERQDHRGKTSRHKENQLSLPSLDLSKGDLDRVETDRCDAVRGGEVVPDSIAYPVTESRAPQLAPTSRGISNRPAPAYNANLRAQVTNSARISLGTLVPPSAASTVTLFEAENAFEPVAQSTPHDVQKTGKKYTTVPTPTADSRRSSDPITHSDRRSSATLAPPAAQPLNPKSSTLQRKYTLEKKLTTQNGGLRPLSLLKDRDTNKEGDGFKLAGTRPLVLGKKKQKLKVMRDENNHPNSHLRPFQLGRSDSSRMRGILRRDEVLPTVIVRPPSTNAKTGSPYEYR